MKPSKYLLFLLPFLSLLSCSSDSSESSAQNSKQECIDRFLEDFNMSAYTGGDITCGLNYLKLFEDDGIFYSILHNDCADLVPIMLVDCDGNNLCIYITEDGCADMVNSSIDLGIIGIEE